DDKFLISSIRQLLCHNVVLSFSSLNLASFPPWQALKIDGQGYELQVYDCKNPFYLPETRNAQLFVYIPTLLFKN
ncbi:MAG: hypothetical protein JSV31_01670, partial [Desulfobacterales bacterium]